MVAWGLIMTLMCLVNSYTGLITSVPMDITRIVMLTSFISARVFLGLSEAGLFAGTFIKQYA